MTESAQMLSPTLPPQEAPLALIRGEAFTQLPRDLYIPPDAMAVFLEAFEGPLDLLLYLIKKQNLDILDIPIAEVTQQYMEYVEIMKVLSLELAAEYLVMAAMLAEIKSRMLLPRPATLEAHEEDPRAELIRRLQEYERIKQAAQQLDDLPRQQRDVFVCEIEAAGLNHTRPTPSVALADLARAFADILRRSRLNKSHQIQREPLSVRERMAHILAALQQTEYLSFSSFFTAAEGRLGVVVSFLALLELARDHLVEFVQAAEFAPIHVKAAAAA